MVHAPPPLVRSILLEFWKSARWVLLLLAVLSTVSSVAAVAVPYLFSRLVDRLASEAPASASAQDLVSGLISALGSPFASAVTAGFVLYAVLVGVARALERTQDYLAQICSESLAFVTSTTLFDRLLHKTAAFFVEHNPVEIESAGQRGEQALQTVVHLTLAWVVTGVVQILLSLVLMGVTVSMEIVAVVVAYGAAFIGLSAAADHRSTRYLEAAIDAGQDSARFVGNALAGMETLRHFGAHGWMRSLFASKATEVFDNWRAYSLGRIGFACLQGAALAVQLAVTFLLLMPRLEAGAISVGDIVLFNTLLLQLNRPFEAIGVAINEWAKARGNLAPLRAIWTAPEEPVLASTRPLQLSGGTLRFDDVGYRYDNGRGVSGISFTAARGGITTLTGETGAGKSTVFRLALKSLEPQTGTITIDGLALSDIARADWYARIGVVPQDILLLNDTLATNIALGRPVDEQRLRHAAAQAAVLSTIEALPEGFDTQVGERGLKLSGGERQRIAIARALYGDPDILFLDEASSALDAATERDILAQLRRLADRVTVIAITHRTTTIAPGDTVVRISAPERPDDAVAEPLDA